MVKLLLTRPNTNIEYKNSKSLTALNYARKSNQREVINIISNKLLRKKNKKVKKKDVQAFINFLVFLH